jgi:ABC-2 type transport system ATP-binding protein
VILTSHYMADVTALCKRIIVIDKGKIVFDGDLARLLEQASPNKIIKLELAAHIDDAQLALYGTLHARDGLRAEIAVPRNETSQLAARILTELPIADVTIEDPPIEEVIGTVFAGRNRYEEAEVPYAPGAE